MADDKNIPALVKDIVLKYDAGAEIILFGSRARGDWHEESDWDFLILSSLPERTEVKDEVRKVVFDEVEMKSFNTVQLLWHNKKFWENEYAVTGIYESVKEEGVKV